MNWGTCVVLPHPVAPLTTDARQSLINDNVSERRAYAGNVRRFACISNHVVSFFFAVSASRSRFDVFAKRSAAAAADSSKRARLDNTLAPDDSARSVNAVVESGSTEESSFVSVAPVNERPERRSDPSSSPNPSAATCLVSHEAPLFFFRVDVDVVDAADADASSARTSSPPDTKARLASSRARSYTSARAFARLPLAVASAAASAAAAAAEAVA